jgi:hypothetical protein
MSVKFFWCHSEDCPDYGRARRLDTMVREARCPYCGNVLRITAPDELPAVTHVVDEDNQFKIGDGE